MTYVTAPEATVSVRQSVDTIEAVLHEVLREQHPAARQQQGTIQKDQRHTDEVRVPAIETK